MVTLEKRTISYLSVLAWIRVIDPFSQMKREYDTILDVMQTLRIVLTLSHLRALHDTVRKTFLKVTDNEI